MSTDKVKVGCIGAGVLGGAIMRRLIDCGLTVLAEACAFAERAGIDAARIPQALAGGCADSKQLQEMFPKMVADGLGDHDNCAMVNFYRARKN